VIVSDGSTDHTDEIIDKYSSSHKYIQLLRVSCQKNRDFSSKVNAFRADVRHLNGLEYDFVGNLDADVSFGPNYFEGVLRKFSENRKLGIGDGKVLELQNGEYKE
jgi:biofilm PGA synthesis N-glycosyltransferase PgaC